jgi:hypothetical protein
LIFLFSFLTFSHLSRNTESSGKGEMNREREEGKGMERRGMKGKGKKWKRGRGGVIKQHIRKAGEREWRMGGREKQTGRW